MFRTEKHLNSVKNFNQPLRSRVQGSSFDMTVHREYSLFVDVAKKDMRRVGVTEKDGRDRVRSRQMICCAEP